MRSSIGIIIVEIFFTGALLWLLLRIFAKNEADLSTPRYPIFGACYWFLTFMAATALQLGPWTLLVLVIATILAIYHFFYVTMAKSVWLGIAFVALKLAADFGVVLLMEHLKTSVAS